MLFVVKEAQNVKEIEKLLSYTENPLNEHILVICYKGKSIRNSKLAKSILKNGIILIQFR